MLVRTHACAAHEVVDHFGSVATSREWYICASAPFREKSLFGTRPCCGMLVLHVSIIHHPRSSQPCRILYTMPLLTQAVHRGSSNSRMNGVEVRQERVRTIGYVENLDARHKSICSASNLSWQLQKYMTKVPSRLFIDISNIYAAMSMCFRYLWLDRFNSLSFSRHFTGHDAAVSNISSLVYSGETMIVVL